MLLRDSLRAQREGVGYDIARRARSCACERRDVKRVRALVLKLQMLDHGVVARDQFGDGVGHAGARRRG